MTDSQSYSLCKRGLMDTKTKLVNAAMAVFKKKGLEKTKVSDIVKQAGVAQGTFYLYFSSKLSVMPAIAQGMVLKMREELTNTVNPAAPLPQQVDQIVESIFKTVDKHRDILAFLYTGLTQSADITKWESLYAPIYEWIKQFLQRNCLSLRAGMNAPYTARLLIACIEEAAEQVFLFSHRDAQEAARQQEETAVFVKHALGV